MTPKDILQLESSDMRQAYLFEENGRWYAYEHSANRIEKFVKGFVDFKHKVQDVCGRIKVESFITRSKKLHNILFVLFVFLNPLRGSL